MEKNLTKQEIEFLKESNAIEREYSEEALEDAIKTWKYALKHNKQITKLNIICQIHKRLLKNLNPKIAGKIRTCRIYVGNKTNYRECMKPDRIKEELWLLGNKGVYPTYSESMIRDWHIQFENIHPFEDGNGRIGRIIMNIQRLNEEKPLLIIHEGKEQQEYYKWFKGLS